MIWDDRRCRKADARWPYTIIPEETVVTWEWCILFLTLPIAYFENLFLQYPY
jgi:hypothetical protein